MNSSTSHIVQNTADKTKQVNTTNAASEKKLIFWENVNIIFKTTGVITWFFIFLLTLLELKRYFNFDLIPGYNSAIDDVYNAVREILVP